jgi:hypothetical protein
LLPYTPLVLLDNLHNQINKHSAAALLNNNNNNEQSTKLPMTNKHLNSRFKHKVADASKQLPRTTPWFADLSGVTLIRRKTCHATQRGHTLFQQHYLFNPNTTCSIPKLPSLDFLGNI